MIGAGGVIVTAGVLVAVTAVAQAAVDYPVKPVRMVVPFVAGASYDTIARIVALPLAEVLRQQIVIDNRAGASGIIGANLVA